MTTVERVIACLVVGVILEVLWVLIFGKLSSTPIVIGITVCALVTQKQSAATASPGRANETGTKISKEKLV